jgi:hypothetical protein
VTGEMEREAGKFKGKTYRRRNEARKSDIESGELGIKYERKVKRKKWAK